MKRILREPLLHFLLLGGALFASYGMVSKRDGTEPGKIIISDGQVAAMAEGFTRTWQRPPTRTELDGLVRDAVLEEVYCREAIALGLDKDDSIIRRRLRQKIEFLAEDFGATTEPSEEELAAFLTKHSDRFAPERCFTFQQVFLSQEKRGDRLQADAAALLDHLKQEGSTADAGAMGDSSLLTATGFDESERAVASQFGPDFAVELAKVKPLEWSGPIRSSYGWHLVFVSARTTGRTPPLAEVRDKVRNELMNERRQAANQRFIDGLLAKYHVSIQPFPPEPPIKPSAMNR